MLKKTLSLVSFMVFLSLLTFSSVEAQEQEVDIEGGVPLVDQVDSVDGQVMVHDPMSNKIDVNIYNAEILRQDKNKIDISLVFDNAGYTVSGVKYSVALMEPNGEFFQTKRDEKFYADSFDLLEGESLNKVIKYEAPSYLAGNFELWVFAGNEEGMNLSLAHVADIELNGSGNYVEIIPSSCFVKIEGEDGIYGTTEGVAVRENETLIVSCELENHYGVSRVLELQTETHRRDLFGEEVENIGMSKYSFDIKPEEKLTKEFVISKPLEPQSYSLKIGLTENKKLVSNEIEVHYVIHGPTATIQNISLDKSYYRKGDPGRMTIVVSGPADGFSGSRLEATDIKNLPVEVVVENSKGEICIKVMDTISTSYPFANYDFNVGIDCYDPIVRVVASDEKGNLLAQKETKISSFERPGEEYFASSQGDSIEKRVFLIILIIAFLIIAMVSLILLIRNGRLNKK